MRPDPQRRARAHVREGSGPRKSASFPGPQNSTTFPRLAAGVAVCQVHSTVSAALEFLSRQTHTVVHRSRFCLTRPSTAHRLYGREVVAWIGAAQPKLQGSESSAPLVEQF